MNLVSNHFAPEQALSILMQIKAGERSGRISLPIQAMLPITRPAALLAFRFGIPRLRTYLSIDRPPGGFNGADELPDELKKLWSADVGLWTANTGREAGEEQK